MLINVKLEEGGQLPVKATEGSIGFDVAAAEDKTLQRWIPTKVSLGFRLEMAQGCWAQLCLRSSVGARGIIIPNGVGVIDADFRGILQMLLMSTVYENPFIKTGERIGQLIFHDFISEPQLRETDYLLETKRNEGGWGSTNY